MSLLFQVEQLFGCKVSFSETCNRWRKSSSSKGPYARELCRHIHKASYSREVAMVFSFSWLAEKMMNRYGKRIRKIIVKVEFVGSLTTNYVNLGKNVTS